MKLPRPDHSMQADATAPTSGPGIRHQMMKPRNANAARQASPVVGTILDLVEHGARLRVGRGR